MVIESLEFCVIECFCDTTNTALLQNDVQYFKGEFSVPDIENIMKLTISPHPTKRASPTQPRRDLSVSGLISFRGLGSPPNQDKL